MKAKIVKAPQSASATTLGIHLGVSRQRIAGLVTEGVIHAEPDGRFDLDRGRMAYINWLRAPERRSARAEAAAKYHDMKARYLALKVAEAEGKLMDLDEAIAFVDQLGALMVREAEALPALVAGRDLTLRRKLEDVARDFRIRISEKVSTMQREMSNGHE